MMLIEEISSLVEMMFQAEEARLDGGSASFGEASMIICGGGGDLGKGGRGGNCCCWSVVGVAGPPLPFPPAPAPAPPTFPLQLTRLSVGRRGGGAHLLSGGLALLRLAVVVPTVVE